MTSFGDLNRMTQFKEKAGAQRDLVSAGLFVYPVLQAADVLAYRAHEVPVGEDQRQHVELMRDVAVRFNARFGETLVVPEARIPEVGARIMDLQVPDRKMSTTGGSEQGTVLVLDEPETIAKKIRSAVTDSGTEVVRGPDKAGISNLIDILAAVRGIDPEAVEREFDGPGYGAFKQAVADAVIDYLAPVRERYQELRADEAGSSGRWPRAPRRPARSPPTRWSTCAGRWGWVRSGRADNVCAVALADLELDLDVFAGPFDLLLTLILREEVDLLEVDLADVVITYIDHLERRGELDLEAATEFLVLIAALLELKSRLLLPGEEIEEIELDPGEAAEELLARLLAAHRYRAAAAHLRERLEAEEPHRFRSAPLPPHLRKASLTEAHAVYDPAGWRARSATCSRCPPPVDVRHITVPKVTVAERLVHLRDAAAARELHLLGGGRARRTGSRWRSPCTRCSSSTSRARPPGPRTSRSPRSPSRRWPAAGRLSGVSAG